MARDARGRLGSDPFTWRATKDGTVRIARGGRVVTVVRGGAAERLLARLEAADADGVQDLLARATGHYRHAT